MSQTISARQLGEFRAFAEELTALASAAVRAQLAHPSVEIKEDGSPVAAVDLAVEEVLRLADSIAVMADGRVRACGPVDEIASRPDLADAGLGDVGTVISARIAGHDEAMGITEIETAAGRLRLNAVLAALLA